MNSLCLPVRTCISVEVKIVILIIFIVFSEPVVVTTSPMSQTVSLYDMVVLVCAFDNAVAFRWQKDNVPLPNTENQNTFTVNSMTPLHIGYYRCVGEGRGGDTASTVQAALYIEGKSLVYCRCLIHFHMKLGILNRFLIHVIIICKIEAFFFRMICHYKTSWSWRSNATVLGLGWWGPLEHFQAVRGQGTPDGRSSPGVMLIELVCLYLASRFSIVPRCWNWNVQELLHVD